MTKNYKSLLEWLEKDNLNLVDAFADYMEYKVVPRSIKKISDDMYKINKDFYTLRDIRDILNMKIPPQIVFDWYEYRQSREGKIFWDNLLSYFLYSERMENYSGYKSLVRHIYGSTYQFQTILFTEACRNLWNEIKKTESNICNSIRKRYNKFVKKS
jgi:hypothetical protein